MSPAGGRLAGRRAVVTGASRGLGRALAEAFAAQGAELVVTARTGERLGAVMDACRARGARVTGIGADLADPGAAARAGDEALAALGRVDVLVNNAGILGERMPLEDYPLGLFAEVMAVTVTGTLALTQRIIPGMTPGSVIVNVTSGAAARPGWGAYAVSRAALDAMTRMWRDELADRAIRCVAVNPGPVRTAMRAAAHPEEEPATVPHPNSVVEPFLAIAEGADTDWRVEAGQWGRG